MPERVKYLKQSMLLVHAGKLIQAGIPARDACRGAIAEALTDDPEMLAAIGELGASLF